MLPGLAQLLLGLLLEPHWAPWAQLVQLVCQQLGLLLAWAQPPWWSSLRLLLLLAGCLVSLLWQQVWGQNPLTQLPPAQRQALLVLVLALALPHLPPLLLVCPWSCQLLLRLQALLWLSRLRQQRRQQLQPLPCAAHWSVLSSSWLPTAGAATQCCCLALLLRLLLPLQQQRRLPTAAAQAAA